MGGAVGHLYHLYDNPDLTFGEIKDIIKSAAAGKLEQVSEKLDGLNLVFTWDESGSGLRVARNAGDIKSGGMDANALAAKFADRGNLADAFNSAYKVLNQALGSLPPAARAKVFGPDGRIWYSMELIYSANPNVIQYDGNNVVFHGWPVFKAMPDGTVEKGPGGGVGVLSKYIEQMQKHVKEKDWRVRGPALVALKKMSNKAVPQKALTAINRAMANARVGDDDTIQDYLFNYVIADAKAAKMPPAALHDIAARVAGIPGAPNLTQIKSKIDKSLVPAVQDYVKVGPKTIKSAIAPIESAIHEFAVEALRGLTSTLISNSPGEVDRLRGEVQKAVSAIEASGNEQAMSILKTQMAKLGNIENLATPMEGVVFIHNGNAYKFTGAFAPVNQILGLFKYGRGKTKLASEGLSLLSSLIQEAFLLEDSGDFSEEAAAAKKRYEDAIQKKKDFEKKVQNRANFIAAMKAAGYDPFRDSDRNPEMPKPKSSPSIKKRYDDVQKIKNDPNNQFYPLPLKGTSELSKEIEKEIATATKNYRYFSPKITGYSYSGARKLAVASDEEEKFTKKPVRPITKIVPMTWYPWSLFGKLPEYGSTVDSEEDEERADVGVGPGEERLEYIFGGLVKGGSVSYDVVTPDKRKWEVKALETPSSTIRPGTEGKAAIAAARERLAGIVNQLRDFSMAASSAEAQQAFDEDQIKLIRYIGDFIAAEYEEIVGKGEVTSTRFRQLYGLMDDLNNDILQSVPPSKKEIPTVVGLNDKKIPVDKPTFFDVAQIVKKSVNDDEVIKPFFDAQELVVSTLKDPAFRNPRAFFKSFFSSIKASSVFRQVDGVFVVNRKIGFIMVPKDQFDSAFEFSKISQATPRFKFVGFKSSPVANK